MWQEFKDECSRCNRCKVDNLLYPEAFPILMKSPPREKEILFILEAPNLKDTTDVNKKYLTIDPHTDPSGRFFYELFINELKFDLQDLFVTNSVLCLPAKNVKNGSFPVTSLQQTNCSVILRRMIDSFSPMIVCPLGTKALSATRRIYEHDYKRMSAAVALPTSWHGRILFPLYHTSAQARNPRNGRPEKQQRADWRQLREIWDDAKEQQYNAADGKTRRGF